MFNQRGFTLIELVSVMVIMGVVASVTIKKFNLVTGNAEIRALEAAVNELNARESLTWTNIKLSPDGWIGDDELYGLIDTALGQGFEWNPGPTVAGGTLHYGGQSMALTRVKSIYRSAGRWQ